jgi:hypothetical protein
MNNRRYKRQIIAYLVVIIILMGLGLYSIFNQEIRLKPVVGDFINSMDYESIYNFYTDSVPEFKDVPSYGNGDIEVIGFLDIIDEDSDYFFDNIFPKLNQSYIEKNIIRYVGVVPITFEDFKSKNDRFIVAKFMSCIGELRSESYYPIYFELSETNLFSKELVLDIVNRYNLSGDDLDNCFNDSELMGESISISENQEMGIYNGRFYIGIEGINFNNLYGVPSMSKFNRTIRDYEVLLGG